MAFIPLDSRRIRQATTRTHVSRQAAARTHVSDVSDVSKERCLPFQMFTRNIKRKVEKRTFCCRVGTSGRSVVHVSSSSNEPRLREDEVDHCSRASPWGKTSSCLDPSMQIRLISGPLSWHVLLPWTIGCEGTEDPLFTSFGVCGWSQGKACDELPNAVVNTLRNHSHRFMPARTCGGTNAALKVCCGCAETILKQGRRGRGFWKTAKTPIRLAGALKSHRAKGRSGN